MARVGALKAKDGKKRSRKIFFPCLAESSEMRGKFHWTRVERVKIAENAHSPLCRVKIALRPTISRECLFLVIRLRRRENSDYHEILKNSLCINSIWHDEERKLFRLLLGHWRRIKFSCDPRRKTFLENFLDFHFMHVIWFHSTSICGHLTRLLMTKTYKKS